MSDPTPPPGWGQPPQGQQPPGQPGPGYGPPPDQQPTGLGQPQGYGQPPQGYGAPPGYGQPGQTSPYQQGPYQQGPYQQPPSGNRTPIIIGVVAVVVLVGIGAAVALLGGGDDGAEEEASTSASELSSAVDDLSSEVEDAFSDLASPPPTETPAGEAEESVFELEVGDCFNSGANNEEVQSVGVVPCEAPHDSEVFHLVDYPDDGSGFPGQEALNTFADEQCQGQAFTDYVGRVWAESRFFTSQLTPTEGSWEQGDREVVCLLYDPTTQLEGSVRGSNQ